MDPSDFSRNSPGLLVSVRSAAEALAALAGGADVIDVKEPDRGPLGAADPQTIAEIVRVVAGQVPVTAAAGELLDVGAYGATRTIESLASGVALCKIGLRGCRNVIGWEVLWSQTAARCGAPPNHARSVAVVYADWQSAGAPEPSDVLRVAAELGCPALLVDTCDKAEGDLLDHWSANELGRFIPQVRAHSMVVVLAGSLNGPSMAAAVQLAPDLVAVRGAACENGRGGSVSVERVAALKQMITNAATRSMKQASA